MDFHLDFFNENLYSTIARVAIPFLLGIAVREVAAIFGTKISQEVESISNTLKLTADGFTVKRLTKYK